MQVDSEQIKTTASAAIETNQKEINMSKNYYRLISLTIIGAISAMLSMASFAHEADLLAYELAPYFLDFAPEQLKDTDTNGKYFIADIRTMEARRAAALFSRPVAIIEIDHRFMHRLNYKRQWQPTLS